MTLQQELDRLEETLAAKAPSLLAKFNPPATDAQIENLRSCIADNTDRRGSIGELEAWFRWHNGAPLFAAPLIPGGELISIEATIDEFVGRSDNSFVAGMRRDAIWVLDDAGGDGYFYDVASSRPQVFHQMLEDPNPDYYGSLAEFVGFVTRCYEDRVITVDDDGRLDGNDDGFFAARSSYAAALA